MKVLLVVGGSRAGLEFFFSLLDGHTEILQFPGFLVGDEKLIQILSYENCSDISSSFIKNYSHFFDSSISEEGKLNPAITHFKERHYMLGENKDQHYFVDKEKFIQNFSELFEKKNKSNLNNRLYENLLMLHEAYLLTCGHDINKKKVMIINCHLIDWTKFFIKRIMGNVDFEIIHTIRNPLSAISSPVNNWLKYNSGKFFFAREIYFHLDLVINGIKKLKKFNKKIFLIQLEILHKNNLSVMDDFCKTYNLRDEECLKKSTFHNLKWWGDIVSGKDLNGINANFNINFDQKNFFRRDIKFLEFILKDYIVFYKYKFTTEASKFFFNIFPMRCEIIVWKNTFKHKRPKHILSIPFFYIIRLLFVNKFSQKNLNMPRAFGME